MKKSLKILIISLIISIIIGGYAIYSNASTLVEIKSQGKIESENIIFNAEDFSVALDAFETGKQQSWLDGFDKGVDAVIAKPQEYGINLKTIINDYDSIACTDLSVDNYSGTYTFNDEGLWFCGAFESNWTANWGGRNAPVTGTAIIYNPDGTVCHEFFTNRYCENGRQGSGTTKTLVYVPKGAYTYITVSGSAADGARSIQCNISGQFISFK